MSIAMCVVFCLSVLLASAQKDIATTDHFIIEGKVKKTIDFSLKNISSYKTISIDSITIYNHLMERRSIIKNVKRHHAERCT